MQEFGRRVGVSKSAVSLWITKRDRTEIAVPRLREIAKVTGEPIENLELLVYGTRYVQGSDAGTFTEASSVLRIPDWGAMVLAKLDEISARLDLLAEADGAIRQEAAKMAAELAAIQRPDGELSPPAPRRQRGTPRG